MVKGSKTHHPRRAHWHWDYSELKAAEKQQVQEISLLFPPNA